MEIDVWSSFDFGANPVGPGLPFGDALALLLGSDLPRLPALLNDATNPRLGNFESQGDVMRRLARISRCENVSAKLLGIRLHKPPPYNEMAPDYLYRPEGARGRLDAL